MDASWTKARKRFSEMVDEVSTTGTELVITKHGRPVAVIIGHDEHEGLVETLNILSDPDTMAAVEEAESDIAAGRVISIS